MNTCNHSNIYIKLQKALAYGHLCRVTETLQQNAYMTADFPDRLLQLLLNAGNTAMSGMLCVFGSSHWRQVLMTCELCYTGT